MIRAPLSTTSVLDESADVVRMTAAPWGALLILASMPYRFLQVLFLDRVLELGSSAGQYGDVLRTTAYWTAAAFVLSRCGRAVYARACRLAASRAEGPGTEALRVPLAALLGYIFVSSITELLTYMTFFTLIGPLGAAMLSGLAIGTMELNDQSGVRAPLRLITRYGRAVRTLSALILVFIVAVIVAAINIWAAFGSMAGRLFELSAGRSWVARVRTSKAARLAAPIEGRLAKVLYPIDSMASRTAIPPRLKS